MAYAKRFFVFIIACLLGSAYASTIFEKRLADFGYEDFTAKTYKCNDFYITLPQLSGYAFLSLYILPKPSKIGNASVTVFFNNAKLAELEISKLECTETCLARISLPSDLIKEESLLRVCLIPSSGTTQLTLSNESTIGYYKMPVFEKSGFRKCIVADNKCVDKYRAVLGEDLNVRIEVTNLGNESAYIVVEAKRSVAGERKTKKELGNLRFDANILPNETKEFYYTVRVKESSRFNLPPAALYYQDAFGKQKMILSNPVTIYPKGFPDVNAVLIADSASLDKVEVRVIVSNNSANKLNDVEVKLIAKGASVTPEKQVISVAGKTQEKASFQLKPLQKELYVSCIVLVEDYNQELRCNEIRINLKEENYVLIAIFSTIFIIIALAVFIYLNSQKS